jgi:adenosine 3'-phospho 5'-phosphosulfate transporter B2
MIHGRVTGQILHGKTYETYEYVVGATIAFGLFLFISSAEGINFQKNSISGEAQCGVVLLLLYLLFDSSTGQFQTRMFQLYPQMSPLQMMLIVNAFSSVMAFVTLIHEGKLSAPFNFLHQHNTIVTHIIIFSIVSTVGQLFIFHTVKNFGPVIFSIIMSARILCSTLLSCFVYGHSITELGFIGILIGKI